MMRIYQLLWKRLLGLTACFVLGFLMIVMTGTSQNDGTPLENTDAEPLVTESRTTRTSLSQAISFVGGKLKLLVVYNEEPANNVHDPDQDLQYGADDIVAEERSEEVNQYGNYEDTVDDARVFQKGDFDYSVNRINSENDTTKTTTKDRINEETRTFSTLGTAVVTESIQHISTVHKKVVFGTLVKLKSDLARFKNHPTGLKAVKSEVNNLTLVEDGVFWAKEVELLVPKGISDDDVSSFLDRMHRINVISVEPPTWNRCGRPKNQFVVFEDGTQVCARYRAPHNYLVQGEVMSFYLSRLLGVWNVPPVTLLSLEGNDQWNDPNVNKSLLAAGWNRNSTVAVIQWIEGLERDRMPQVLLDTLEKSTTLSSTSEEIRMLNSKQIVELLQWSDLILFDYVTGNYDRVASMQDAADREKKPSILGETIHNLVKSRRTDSIWLIDNESGLLDAYSLLYGEGGASNGNSVSSDTNRFVSFHRNMLQTICLFRRSTYERLKWLSQQQKPVKVLLNYIHKYEPNFKKLPSVARYAEFMRNFKLRIAEAYAHIKKCRTNLLL